MMHIYKERVDDLDKLDEDDVTEDLRLVDAMEKMTSVYRLLMQILAEQMTLPAAAECDATIADYLHDLGGDTYEHYKDLLKR